MQVLSGSEPIEVDLGERSATLVMDGQRVATFDIAREKALTAARVEELSPANGGHQLVVFERSSPQARELLRNRGLSYASPDGELYIHAPPIHIERPAQRRAVGLSPALTAPFATRASRLSRWLLLHVDERLSFRELANTVQLSEAMVSRAAHALADDGLIAIESDPADARRRLVRLRNARALLDAFEHATATRRPRRLVWDVGARDVSGAIERLRKAASHLALPYAVSGLAGAAFVRRVVEPADISFWIAREDSEQWAEALTAVPSRPGPGRVTALLAPDPFVLSLATSHKDVQVADPVQLYLDCRRVGERALEAADAIRAEMNW